MLADRAKPHEVAAIQQHLSTDAQGNTTTVSPRPRESAVNNMVRPSRVSLFLVSCLLSFFSCLLASLTSPLPSPAPVTGCVRGSLLLPLLAVFSCLFATHSSSRLSL